MTVTIYHNPRCSKSRQALELLQARGIDPDIVEYLETSPDAEALTRLLDLLGLGPRRLMRTGESAYKENKPGDGNPGREALISAMADYPILIERPIVVADGKARTGRPPESVLEIV